MKKNVIKEKSFDFALRIIELRKYLEKNKEYVIARQIMRSGTSVGANIREAEYAVSKADFIHKMSIALKEANETEYWLELLFYSKAINEELFRSLSNDIKEILKLLISIIKSTKNPIGK